MVRARFLVVAVAVSCTAALLGAPTDPLDLVGGGALGATAAGASPECPLASFTGRTVVRFDGAVPAAVAARRLAAAGARDVEAVADGVAVGRLPGGRAPVGAVATSPERLRPWTAVSNDRLAPVQWSLDVMHNDAAISRTIDSGVTVAVLDSGVDATHPDLVGQVLAGGDVVDVPVRPIPAGVDSDTVGHGTAVSGIVAAIRGNGIGIAGVAPGARILPVRVGDESGVTTAAFIRGIQFAVASGARILNLSFGGCGSDPAEQAAIDDAAAKGAIVVASAGNLEGGAPPTTRVDVYPAAYRNVLAVGATTPDDRIATYSVEGPFVDVTAPGGLGDANPANDLTTDVMTTWVDSPGEGCPDDCYVAVAGTSFAAPQVAGVLALVLGAAPSTSAADAVGILQQTSVDLGAPGFDPAFGAGRVDALGAAAWATGSRTVARVAGADRFATAAALSAAAHPTGATTAYIARGDVFSPDALAAGPAASVGGAPLLLSAACQLPAATAGELARLQVTTVVVLGGPTAICDAVLQQIATTGSRPTVRRVAGVDRYDTAARLATDAFASGAAAVHLARGDVFSPDALVGGTAAGVRRSPILLAEACALPASTAQALDALQATSVVVLGGPQAVCEAVVLQLRAQGRTVTRLSGSDRYATAVAVARAAFPAATSGVLVARGDAFSPDALAAAPFAVAAGAPLLLGSRCAAPPSAAIEVNDRDASTVRVIGGPGAICDEVLGRYR